MIVDFETVRYSTLYYSVPVCLRLSIKDLIVPWTLDTVYASMP